MDRNYQLSFCKQCSKQSFDLNKGIICSLTNEQATFESTCPHFEVDPIAKKRMEGEQKRIRNAELAEESMGMSAIGINSGVTAGIIAIALGIVLLFVEIIFFQVIILYTFIPIVLGIIAIFKGLSRKSKEKRNKRNKHATLDSDLGD